MNYLAEIIAWNRWKETNQPPATVIALWHEIMAVWNRCGWLDEFKVPNGLLQIGAGLSRKEFDNARQWLIREGRIVYKKSNRVNQAGTYKVIPIVQKGQQEEENHSDCPKGATNGTQEGQQEGQRTAHTGGNEGSTAGEHNINKTKLNKTNKINYAEFVSLSEAEYQKLIDSHGQELVSRIIEILNNYKASSGKKYKSDYHTILNWVVERAKKEKPQQPTTPKPADEDDENYQFYLKTLGERK